MIIEKVNTGPIGTNTYIVISNDKKAFVIDPGGDPEKIEDVLQRNDATLVAVLLTHEHFDHCLAVAHFQKKGITVYAHEVAVKNFEAGIHKISRLNFIPENFSVDVSLKDGQILDLCGERIEVIHTPGHTSGSVCYKLRDIIFSGDTLFRESIGRTDLATASFDDLILSIKSKLYSFDDNCRVLPGHGEETTLLHEKTYNFFTR